MPTLSEISAAALDREHAKIAHLRADLDNSATFAAAWEQDQDQDQQTEASFLSTVAVVAKRIASTPVVQYAGNRQAVEARAKSDWMKHKERGVNWEDLLPAFTKDLDKNSPTEPERRAALQAYCLAVKQLRYPEPTREQTVRHWKAA